ncbi:MAG: hypothetical protein LBJ92_03710 [Holosporales bacterium]|nr:hypothetical protein [Holosporales bacterium]
MVLAIMAASNATGSEASIYLMGGDPDQLIQVSEAGINSLRRYPAMYSFSPAWTDKTYSALTQKGIPPCPPHPGDGRLYYATAFDGRWSTVSINAGKSTQATIQTPHVTVLLHATMNELTDNIDVVLMLYASPSAPGGTFSEYWSRCWNWATRVGGSVLSGVPRFINDLNSKWEELW